MAQSTWWRRRSRTRWGRTRLIQLTHSLKAPGFNPWNLSSEKTVTKIACKCNLYGYNPALVSKLSLVMVGKDGGLRVWTLPDGQVSEQLPR
jgi:hypothetical protein